MKYTLEKDKIVIIGKEDYNPKHIFECGQIFSYKKEGSKYIVYSQDKKAEVIEFDKGYNIITSSPEWFEIFFDLRTDYTKNKRNIIAIWNFKRTYKIWIWN